MTYIYSTLGYTGYDISIGCFFNTAVGPMETSNCVAISVKNHLRCPLQEGIFDGIRFLRFH